MNTRATPATVPPATPPSPADPPPAGTPAAATPPTAPAVGTVVATVGGVPVPVSAVDEREALLRATPLADALPAAGTSEGRQLRRWLTQLLVTERVVAREAAALGLSADAADPSDPSDPSDSAAPDTANRSVLLDATAAHHPTNGLTTPPPTPPSEGELLPDAAARLELGSVASAVLAAPPARALFAQVTASVTVSADEVAAYHARNPGRHAAAPAERDRHGWELPPAPPSLDEARTAIEANLLGAARRRAFRIWLDERRAELVELAPGYEHPGDPRQPDNTHRH